MPGPWASRARAAGVAVGLLTGSRPLVELAFLLGVVGIVLAFGAAALRFRLYDVDRIISRTVAYAVLTVLLGGGYAAVVLGVGQMAGLRSDLLVAVATLTVATAFRPARRRIQLAVDSRFNRPRFDASETVRAFRVRVRDEVDLRTLTDELLAVVSVTMQPATVALQMVACTDPPARVIDAVPAADRSPRPGDRGRHAQTRVMAGHAPTD